MAEAPRFRAYWKHIAGTSVTTMRRMDWNTVIGLPVSPIIFDVSSTPLSGIAHASSVIASVAHQYSLATAGVSIFRHDEADAPYTINQDKYEVWTDLSPLPRLHEVITAASTSYNDNFKDYCQENVFFVKEEHGPDHWLTQIPSSVSLTMKST